MEPIQRKSNANLNVAKQAQLLANTDLKMAKSIILWLIKNWIILLRDFIIIWFSFRNIIPI